MKEPGQSVLSPEDGAPTTAAASSDTEAGFVPAAADLGLNLLFQQLPCRREGSAVPSQPALTLTLTHRLMSEHLCCLGPIGTGVAWLQQRYASDLWASSVVEPNLLNKSKLFRHQRLFLKSTVLFSTFWKS